MLADVEGDQPRELAIDVEETLRALLAREDTDNNVQITVEDLGPKVRPFKCLSHHSR